MANQFYSRRHLREVGGFYSKDTPEAIADRLLRRKASNQANAEMMAKFAPLTAENAQAAVNWQENRIRELEGEFRAAARKPVRFGARS